MGRDKALLELGGKPLVAHALAKLRRICAETKILSQSADLVPFAPLVPDNFSDCGPLGGLEAALTDSPYPWNLVLPVDLPFMPTCLLDDWLWSALAGRICDLRMSMMATDGQAHPTLLILHRDVGPYLRDALRKGNYKVLTVLEDAAAAIAAERRVKVDSVFWRPQWDDPRSPKWRDEGKPWRQRKLGRSQYVDEFWNLNTPKEFAEAELHLDALDT